jgi:hypothetical protein
MAADATADTDTFLGRFHGDAPVGFVCHDVTHVVANVPVVLDDENGRPRILRHAAYVIADATRTQRSDKPLLDRLAAR